MLGLVQGLTEFLPVSSSGHLVVVPYLLSWQPSGLAFDVALHFGTLIAVIAYFAGDVWFLMTRTFGIGSGSDAETQRARKTVTLLIIGSIPAAVIGFLLRDFFADQFENPRIVAFFLLVTAGLLFGAERLRRQRATAVLGTGASAEEVRTLDVGRDEGTVSPKDALVVGLAQALAIFPGISRAGSTIAAGMVRGLSREGAARFSFLLSIPIILGASAYELTGVIGGDVTTRFTGFEVLVGTAAAAASGFWAIRFLLRLVSQDDLTGFARYVALLGVLTFVGTLWLGNPSAI